MLVLDAQLADVNEVNQLLAVRPNNNTETTNVTGYKTGCSKKCAEIKNANGQLNLLNHDLVPYNPF